MCIRVIPWDWKNRRVIEKKTALLRVVILIASVNLSPHSWQETEFSQFLYFEILGGMRGGFGLAIQKVECLESVAHTVSRFAVFNLAWPPLTTEFAQ